MHTEVHKYVKACLSYCFNAEIVPSPPKVAAVYHPVTRPLQPVVVDLLIVDYSLTPVAIALSCP